VCQWKCLTEVYWNVICHKNKIMNTPTCSLSWMFRAVNTWSYVLSAVNCHWDKFYTSKYLLLYYAFYIMLNSLWFFVTKMATYVVFLSTAGLQGNECQWHQEFKGYQQHQYGCNCTHLHHKAEVWYRVCSWSWHSFHHVLIELLRVSHLDTSGNWKSIFPWG
jgi:hypothetical protein